MKIGVIIPIRYSSERLPGKALLKINKKTIMNHLITRALHSSNIQKDNIVICTTNNIEDDAIVEEALKLGVKAFRGSEDDIIDRFKCAVDQFGFDYIIQIDGDDPFTEPKYMDACLEKLISSNEIDIVICQGLPLGMASKAFTANALRRVWEQHVSQKNDTGFIWYFTKTELCKKDVIFALPEHYDKENKIRLTLDYKEDFELFEKIIYALGSDGQYFGIDEIMTLFNDVPDIFCINSSLNEDYWKRTNEKAVLEYRDFKGDTQKVEA